jgi:hypothetical protein
MARDDETTTLLDDVTLLLRDDRGRPRNGRVPVGMVLAGAVLAALALDGAVRISGPGEAGTRRGRVVPTGVLPSDARLVPLLDRVAGRKPKDAVWRLSSRGIGSGPAERLEEQVLTSLAERGLLERRAVSVLGVFRRTVWVPGPDTAARRAVLDRVRSALTGSGPVEARTAATVSLLLAADVLPKIAPDLDRRALRARARQIADSEWAGAAVKKALDEMYAAVLAAVAAGGAVSASS